MNTGIVCILDALGTKGVWDIDNPNEYLKRIKAIHKSLSDLTEYTTRQYSHLEFDYLTFSDTIIITLSNIGEMYPMLLPFTRIIDGLYSTCLAENLLMRGAMSFGKFVKEGNIIIGPAIDDAAFWHDKAQLVGCVLTPNTTLLYEAALSESASKVLVDYDYSQHALKYDTPFKGMEDVALYQINWPLSTYKAWDIPELRNIPAVERIKTILGRYPIPPDAYKKHLNTLKFFNFSVSKVVKA